MRVKLKSDFRDYYDHWFDLDGVEFSRMSTGGPNRQEMFAIMELMGIKVVPHGYVEDMAKRYDHKTEVVVYTDLTAHRGEGKIKMPIDLAIDIYPENLSSLYIEPQTDFSVSLRYLQIGENNFWLRYIGKEDWRSNYGDVSIDITDVDKAVIYPINLPLFAIDFVADSNNTLYAIDFNQSPQIRGTGIEDIVKSRVVAKLIKKAIEQQQRRG